MSAIEGLVELKSYNTELDLITGRPQTKDPTFGEKDDQRARYATFTTGDKPFELNNLVAYIKKSKGDFGDCIVSIYTLKSDNYTLDNCLGTSRIHTDDIVDAGQNVFKFDNSIHMNANTHYAIYFAMDNTNNVYGQYRYLAGDFVSDDLFAVKVNGNGNTVNENKYKLGTPLMLLNSLKTDRTELNEVVKNSPKELGKILNAANDVLLNANATQDEINFAVTDVKDQIEAFKVISLIDEIGDVTLKSADAINAAKSAYNILTGSQ